MYAAFPEHADAVARSQEIADQVDIELELGKRHFPDLCACRPSNAPKSFSAKRVCRACRNATRATKRCARWRTGTTCSGTTGSRAARHQHPGLCQLLLDRLGLRSRIARAQHSRDGSWQRRRCPGRVTRLYLSHVCPIKYDLLFERFLDPSRLEAPDIDIDFCKERRGEIIRYVKDKYGEANVAQIGTFGTLAARAAIRDVGRVLGIPLARVNQVVQMVPEELGITLDKALEKSDELKTAYQQRWRNSRAVGFGSADRRAGPQHRHARGRRRDRRPTADRLCAAWRRSAARPTSSRSGR